MLQNTTKEKRTDSASPSGENKVNSPKPSTEEKVDSLVSMEEDIDASTLEALARLCNFVNTHTLSSDSDQSQTHNDKLGPEATKVKKMTDKIRTHALSPDLPYFLHEDSTLGSELIDALTQLKSLETSE